MRKPYSIHLAVWGSSAVLTICHARRTWAADRSELSLRYVLGTLPATTTMIFFDYEHGPRRPHDRNRAFRVVHAYAASHSVYLVAIGAPALPGAVPSGHTPPPPSAEASAAAVGALRRDVASRVLRQQAAGIRLARHGCHPCGLHRRLER